MNYKCHSCTFSGRSKKELKLHQREWHAAEKPANFLKFTTFPKYTFGRKMSDFNPSHVAAASVYYSYVNEVPDSTKTKMEEDLQDVDFGD